VTTHWYDPVARPQHKDPEVEQSDDDRSVAEEHAATLRRAAQRLRELAEPMDTRRLVVHQEPDGTGGYTFDVCAEDATDEEEIYWFTARYHAEWFATMCPMLAEPLAKVLDEHADTAKRVCDDGDLTADEADGLIQDLCGELLSVARAITAQAVAE
jgi:hypothetical protein